MCGAETGMVTTHDSCDVTDVSSDPPRRTSTCRMAVPRVGHAAVLLPRGTILIAGGYGAAAQSTVEIDTP